MKIIEKHLDEYIVDPDQNEINTAFSQIMQDQSFLCEECRFLYWCHFQGTHNVPFNLPDLPPLPIAGVSLKEFKRDFLISDKRNDLFCNLMDFLDDCAIKENAQAVEIIVGGSFLETGGQEPDDIDVAIVVPSSLYPKFERSEKAIKLAVRRPLGLDLMFLPNGFTYNSFRAFSRLMCLANKLSETPPDWSPFPVTKIEFTPRRMVAISC